MRRLTLTTAALLPAIASAHFSILHPPTAVQLVGQEANTPPCGYGTPPSPSGTPHPFLVTGSQVALSTHGEADWQIMYTVDTVPAAAGSGGNWTDLIAPLETEGDGNFCITNLQAPGLGLGPHGGIIREGPKNGWISVRAHMEEGWFYQCAYVRFVEVATLEFPVVCANSTGVSVKYRDGSDDGDDGEHSSKTSKTKTSTKYTNSTTTKTSTDIATSTSAGSTTLTSTDSLSMSMPSPTDVPSDTSSRTIQSPGPGASTITSTSVVIPTDGTTARPTGTGSATSASIAVPTGAATNTKGSPLGMAGFSAVVLGAAVLCAGFML